MASFLCEQPDSNHPWDKWFMSSLSCQHNIWTWSVPDFFVDKLEISSSYNCDPGRNDIHIQNWRDSSSRNYDQSAKENLSASTSSSRDYQHPLRGEVPTVETGNEAGGLQTLQFVICSPDASRHQQRHGCVTYLDFSTQ